MKTKNIRYIVPNTQWSYDELVGNVLKEVGVLEFTPLVVRFMPDNDQSCSVSVKGGTEEVVVVGINANKMHEMIELVIKGNATPEGKAWINKVLTTAEILSDEMAPSVELRGFVELYNTTDDDIEKLSKNFKYHSPKQGQNTRYELIRNTAKQFAELIMSSTPRGREQSVALTNIEDAVMWANASIARNETEVILPITAESIMEAYKSSDAYKEQVARDEKGAGCTTDQDIVIPEAPFDIMPTPTAEPNEKGGLTHGLEEPLS